MERFMSSVSTGAGSASRACAIVRAQRLLADLSAHRAVEVSDLVDALRLVLPMAILCDEALAMAEAVIQSVLGGGGCDDMVVLRVVIYDSADGLIEPGR
jgi:hypothetical protein